MESYIDTRQMKPLQQYFHMELFCRTYSVVLIRQSLDEVMISSMVLSRGARILHFLKELTISKLIVAFTDGIFREF